MAFLPLPSSDPIATLTRDAGGQDRAEFGRGSNWAGFASRLRIIAPLAQLIIQTVSCGMERVHAFPAYLAILVIIAIRFSTVHSWFPFENKRGDPSRDWIERRERGEPGLDSH
ncbi:hypothetical protein BDW67DRAFT_153803 [Aspergillus spinulosporus]